MLELGLELAQLPQHSAVRYQVLDPLRHENVRLHSAAGHPIDAGVGILDETGRIIVRTVATWHEYPSPFLLEAVVLEVVSDYGVVPDEVDAAELITKSINHYFYNIPWLLTIVVALREPEIPVLRVGQARLIGDHRSHHPLADYKMQLWEISRQRWAESPIERDPEKSADLIRKLGRPADLAPRVLLGTGSRVKREQYSFLMRSHGIEATSLPYSVQLPEPQVDGHGDQNEEVLVREPLKHASRWLARHKTFPFVIEDTMLFIEHLNSDFDNVPLLPGPDTKRWWAALGIDGILSLLHGSSRRRAKYVCQLGLQAAAGEYEVYRAEVTGHIAEAPRCTAAATERFPFTNHHYFHTIFVPDGSARTYAEMDAWEFARFDYRRACVDTARNGLLSAAQRWKSHQEELPLIYQTHKS